MKTSSDRGFVAGAILVVLGILLLGSQWLEFPDGAIVGSIGLVFLVAYALTRRYGLLVPGMLLIGIGVGTALQDYGYDPQGGAALLGAGVGFIAIYVVDLFVRGPAHWWPTIPGTILAIIGGTLMAQGTAAAAQVAQLWPLALVAAGVVMLVGVWTTRAKERPTI
jgi:hypothetical protein